MIKINKLYDLELKITNWLKFAEAKVIAIITFNSVQMPALLKIINKSNNINKHIKYLLILLFIVNILIIGLSIYATPNDHKIFKSNKCQIKEDYNILYYNDIYLFTKRYSIDHLIEEYIYIFNIDISQNNKAYINYKVRQIYELSAVTRLKYKFFNTSIIVNLILIIVYILFEYCFK